MAILFLTAAIAFCFTCVNAEYKPVCGLLPAEFVFLLDSSGSEGTSGFKKQTAFVANFTSQLDIGDNNTQVAAVTFSTGVKNNFYLNTYHNKTQLIDAINQIQYLNGETETALGLHYVSTQSLSSTHGARPNFKRYVVVLTDGKSRDSQATIREANRLHNMPNVTVIAIGIGHNVDQSELNAIATDPQHVFTVSNFDLLPTLEKELKDKTCTACGDAPLDLAFLLDSSGSEGQINFQRQLDFVSVITNEFNISHYDTQIAATSFATYAYPEFYFKDYGSKASVLQALQQIQYKNGETQTDLGLAHLWHNVFTSRFGMRNDAKHIAIVVTDGRSSDKAQTIKMANILHSHNVEVFVVAIGHRFDSHELSAIASDKRHVFRVSNFLDLDTIHNTILASICKQRVRPPTTAAPTTTTTTTTLPTTTVKTECGPKPADIVFVLDSSESEKAENFAKEVNFFYTFARQFQVGTDNVQFGSVTFSTSMRNDFWLNTHLHRHDLLNAIQAISYIGEGTNTSYALKFVRENSFTAQHGARPNATHIVIVITDGESSNPSETAKEAAALHHVADKVFAIGVGSEIDQNELSAIASGNQTFTVDNFDILQTIKETLTNAACQR